MTESVAAKLAVAYDVSPVWLLRGEGDPPTFTIGAHESEPEYVLDEFWPATLTRVAEMLEGRLRAMEARLAVLERRR